MKWQWRYLLYLGISLVALRISWWGYKTFRTPRCSSGACLEPYLGKEKLKLWVYYSSFERPTKSDLKLLLDISNFKVSQKQQRKIKVVIPDVENLTFYAHVFLTANDESDPFHGKWKLHKSIPLTKLAIPNIGSFQRKRKTTNELILHWRPYISIRVMEDNAVFDMDEFPVQMKQYLHLYGEDYLPILHLEEILCKDLMPFRQSSTIMPLTIDYAPISYGRLIFFTILTESGSSYGLKEKDLCELKSLGAIPILVLLIVGATHMICDFLVLKSEVSYWRNRNDMVGLSMTTVVWRSFSTLVIFLYLLKEQTSLPILILAGLELIVEVWKMLKAINFRHNGMSDQGKQTQDLNYQITKFLLYFSIPPCFIGVIWSLFHSSHLSWYGWTIENLSTGVYYFGFIFMLPQLFINYKLKSVAHLSRKAFLYKGFNTIVDDVFAFIMPMPSKHRLACLRDDVVFVIYLYQRWLYPVDASRVNEFGDSLDNNADEKED